MKIDEEKVKIKITGTYISDWKLSNKRAEEGIEKLKKDAKTVYKMFKKKYKKK